MAWLGICFGISNTCGGAWSNGVEQNRKTDEERDQDFVEEGFQLARVTIDTAGGGGRKALGMENYCINI